MGDCDAAFIACPPITYGIGNIEKLGDMPLELFAYFLVTTAEREVHIYSCVLRLVANSG
jgi:hypothetical protein